MAVAAADEGDNVEGEVDDAAARGSRSTGRSEAL